jgi:hypothetical protein
VLLYGMRFPAFLILMDPMHKCDWVCIWLLQHADAGGWVHRHLQSHRARGIGVSMGHAGVHVCVEKEGVFWMMHTWGVAMCKSHVCREPTAFRPACAQDSELFPLLHILHRLHSGPAGLPSHAFPPRGVESNHDRGIRKDACQVSGAKDGGGVSKGQN